MSARATPRSRLGAARAADLLLAGALALAAAGAALVVWRPAPRVPDAPPTVPPPPPAAPSAPLLDPALQEAVVRTNVFAATRTAPRARYAPPDAAEGVDAPELAPRAEPPAAAEPPAPRGPDDPPQFYGTIIGPDGPRALLRLDARTPGAQLYAAGEGAGGWRVVRVEPERVVLAVAGERVTLRLPRPGTRRAADSAGAPARAAPDSSAPTPTLVPPT